MTKSLYVGNLEWNTTEKELQDLFEQYGEVRSALIIKDHTTGKSKGFGFVEMTDEEASENATKNIHGKELRGRTLKVNAARDKKTRIF